MLNIIRVTLMGKVKTLDLPVLRKLCEQRSMKGTVKIYMAEKSRNLKKTKINEFWLNFDH